MHEKIGELLQFDERGLEYNGPLRNHPIFLRARAIQEVLNDGVDTNENLIMDLSIICEQLNAEVEQSQLYNKQITVVGTPDSVIVPDVSVNYADGSISIESDTTSAYEDEDGEENEDSYEGTLYQEIDDEAQPALRAITAPFAGFSYRVKPSDTLDKFDDVSYEDIPSHGELLIRQTHSFALTALAEVALYTVAKIDAVTMDFADDKMNDSLRAATERIEKYIDNPTIRGTIINLAEVFAADDLNSKKGFQAISEYTEILLNEPSMQDNSQFTDAVMDYVMHITDLSKADSIATSLILYPQTEDDETMYRSLTSSDERPMLVQTGFGEMITLKTQQHDEDSAKYRLYMPCSVEGNRVGYIPIENIVQVH